MLKILPYASEHAEDCAQLLATIPEWFGRPAANADYLRNLSEFPSWVAVRDAEVVGAVTVEPHFPTAWEIHFLAVRRDCHRQGIGNRLLSQVEGEARTGGVRWLHVKTLGPSNSDPYYARTRFFYEAMGFSPLFESTAIWDAETPALVMVKAP